MAGPSFTAAYQELCAAAGDVLKSSIPKWSSGDGAWGCQEPQEHRGAVGEIGLVLVDLCGLSSPSAIKDRTLGSPGVMVQVFALLWKSCVSYLAFSRSIWIWSKVNGSYKLSWKEGGPAGLPASPVPQQSVGLASPPETCLELLFPLLWLYLQRRDGLCPCSIPRVFHLIWKVIRYPGSTEPGAPVPCVLSGCDFCLFPPKRQEIKCSSS